MKRVLRCSLCSNVETFRHHDRERLNDDINFSGWQFSWRGDLCPECAEESEMWEERDEDEDSDR